MASLHILSSVLIGLYIIIETIANLAVGADILDLLLRVWRAGRERPLPPERNPDKSGRG